MYAGRLVETATVQDLFDAARMPYTRALLDAYRTSLARPAHRSFRSCSPGRPPDLSALPVGCAFPPRCPPRVRRLSCTESHADPAPAGSRLLVDPWAPRSASTAEPAPRARAGRLVRSCRRSCRCETSCKSSRPAAHLGVRRWDRARGLEHLVRPLPRRGACRSSARAGSGKSACSRARYPVRSAPEVGKRDLRRPDYHDAGVLRVSSCDARLNMQMIYQDPFGSPNPRWRVADIVAEPLVSLSDRRPAGAACAGAGCTPALSVSTRPPTRTGGGTRQLSGGQCQRVAIARALTLPRRLLLPDEVVASLDVLVQAQILDLFQRLRAELGLTYLFVAHDLALVKQVSDRVAVTYLVDRQLPGDRRSSFQRPQPPIYGGAAPRPSLRSIRARNPRTEAEDAIPRRSAVADRPSERLPIPHTLPAGPQSVAPSRSRRYARSVPAIRSPATTRSTNRIRRTPRRRPSPLSAGRTHRWRADRRAELRIR